MQEPKTSNSICSFPPIVDEYSEVLILGSIPGPESLRQRQYYANHNNQFWRIIYSVYGSDSDDTAEFAYEAKIRFILEHKIALWDVFHSADRSGALDADIKNPELSDIRGLILAHPRIKRILLAGRTAEKAFRKHFSDVRIHTLYVPSASSAYAKKSIDEKIEDWKSAILFDERGN